MHISHTNSIHPTTTLGGTNYENWSSLPDKHNHTLTLFNEKHIWYILDSFLLGITLENVWESYSLININQLYLLPQEQDKLEKKRGPETENNSWKESWIINFLKRGFKQLWLNAFRFPLEQVNKPYNMSTFEMAMVQDNEPRIPGSRNGSLAPSVTSSKKPLLKR